MKYALAALVSVTGIAAAHPGHNHADWTAPFLHALWMAPIAVAAVATTYFVVKKIKK